MRSRPPYSRVGHRKKLFHQALPLALIQYLTDHPEIGHIVLCLDNDKAGREGAEKIIAAVFACDALKNRAFTFSVEPSPIGNDYNDMLQATLKQMREQDRPSRREAVVLL